MRLEYNKNGKSEFILSSKKKMKNQNNFVLSMFKNMILEKNAKKEKLVVESDIEGHERGI